MDPAESNLNPTTSEFSLSLLNNYPKWEKEFPNFTYYGKNIYAYLISIYFEYFRFYFYIII